MKICEDCAERVKAVTGDNTRQWDNNFLGQNVPAEMPMVAAGWILWLDTCMNSGE